MHAPANRYLVPGSFAGFDTQNRNLEEWRQTKTTNPSSLSYFVIFGFGFFLCFFVVVFLILISLSYYRFMFEKKCSQTSRKPKGGFGISGIWV